MSEYYLRIKKIKTGAIERFENIKAPGNLHTIFPGINTMAIYLKILFRIYINTHRKEITYDLSMYTYMSFNVYYMSVKKTEVSCCFFHI